MLKTNTFSSVQSPRDQIFKVWKGQNWRSPHQDGSKDTRLRTIGPITRDPPCKSQNPATKSHTFWSRRPPRDPNLSWFGLFRPVFVRGGAGQPDLSIPASGEISGISQGRAEATISYIRLYFLLSLTELGLSLFIWAKLAECPIPCLWASSCRCFPAIASPLVMLLIAKMQSTSGSESLL